MRVCHLSQSVSTHGGGISEAIRALALAQEAAGADVGVMSVRDGGGALAPWPAGSPVWLRSQRLPGMLRLPDLEERLDEAGPDVVQVHGLWTWLSVGVPRWAARRRRPAVVSPHGMLDAWALNHSHWKKRIAGVAFERRHLESAACIHALCQSEAESIRAYGLKNPIAVIPNGIGLPMEKSGGLKVEGLKVEGFKVEGLKVEGRRSAEKKTLLFLGRIHPKKGLLNALRAWHEIRGQRSEVGGQEEWTFAIAGWDQDGHEAELKRLCDELGLAWSDVTAAEFVDGSSPLITDHCSPGTSASPTPDSRPLSPVVFTGPAFGETKDALLRSASAFILPSFSEGLPMSILEAWAYRLPVLMTDHCNLPEGFAADAAIRIGTDAGSIAAGMRDLLRSSAADLQSLAGNGRALVEEQFTWQQVAARMDEVYQWLLGGERPDCVW